MTSASTLGCFPCHPMCLYGWDFSRDWWLNPSTTSNLMTQRLGRLCWWKLRQRKHGVPSPYLRLQSLSHPPHSAMGHIFCVYSFTTNVAVKALASLDVPCKCRLRVSFDFLNTIPTCSCNVSKFLFRSAFLLVPLVYWVIWLAKPVSWYIYLFSLVQGWAVLVLRGGCP